MKPLGTNDLNHALRKLGSNWLCQNNMLEGQFEFKSYLKALSFVNAVARLAEKQKHHPEIHFNYCTVKLLLTTHELNNQLSEKDFNFAERTEELILKFSEH